MERGPATLDGYDTLSVRFTVDAKELPGERALLRGLGFEYVGQNGRPITLKFFRLDMRCRAIFFQWTCMRVRTRARNLTAAR